MAIAIGNGFLWVFMCCVVTFLWLLTYEILQGGYGIDHGALGFFIFALSQGLIGSIAYGMAILFKRRLVFSKVEHLLYGSMAAVPIMAFYIYLSVVYENPVGLSWLLPPLSSVVMGFVTTAYLKDESKSAQKAA
jgi:hypothetical protein